MGMKPIHGDGSDPIMDSYLGDQVVSGANKHPSGKFGAIDKKTVTQPYFVGNEAQMVDPKLVTKANIGPGGHESPDHSHGRTESLANKGTGGHGKAIKGV